MLAQEVGWRFAPTSQRTRSTRSQPREQAAWHQGCGNFRRIWTGAGLVSDGIMKGREKDLPGSSVIAGTVTLSSGLDPNKSINDALASLSGWARAKTSIVNVAPMVVVSKRAMFLSDSKHTSVLPAT